MRLVNRTEIIEKQKVVETEFVDFRPFYTLFALRSLICGDAITRSRDVAMRLTDKHTAPDVHAKCEPRLRLLGGLESQTHRNPRKQS
jgi:hypothetical protein